MKSLCARLVKVAYGSWTWTEENPWPPWSAVFKAPLWKEPKYEGLRGLLQKPVAKPVCEKSDTGLVSIQCARESLVESSTGKLIAQSGRVELMAMRCGVPVPSIISSLPFAACIIEVPRLYTAGLHNLFAQLLLSGVPVFIAGESADVKAIVAALKATVAEGISVMLHFTICPARPRCILLRPIWFPFVLPLPLITGFPVTWLLLKDPCRL